MRVAFTTFAVLKQPYGHAEVQEFDDRTPAVFAEAESSRGFIARARELTNQTASNFERDWGAWGRFAVPRFYVWGRETGTDRRASTLTLWRDLSSVYSFVYRGLHSAALKKRSEWFLHPAWPTYAIWWVGDEHVPQWQEAANKLEELHDHGPSPAVFNFKECFDCDGRRVELRSLREAPVAHGT